MKDPIIVLLDEASSALDKEKEEEIQNNIFEFQKGRISIYIAYRLSIIWIQEKYIFYLILGSIIVWRIFDKK